MGFFPSTHRQGPMISSWDLVITLRAELTDMEKGWELNTDLLHPYFSLQQFVHAPPGVTRLTCQPLNCIIEPLKKAHVPVNAEQRVTFLSRKDMAQMLTSFGRFSIRQLQHQKQLYQEVLGHLGVCSLAACSAGPSMFWQLHEAKTLSGKTCCESKSTSHLFPSA